MTSFSQLIFTIWLIASIRNTHGLIAYDCQNSATNITTISLTEVEACPDPQYDYDTVEKDVFVFQKSRFHQIQVQTCLVEVTRLIFHCGMHSHSSLVAGGFYSYVHKVGRSNCKDMHRHHVYHGLYGKVFSDLRSNTTVTTTITIAGSLSSSGKCEGTTFTEFSSSWENVVVTGSIRITLQDYSASLKLDQNEVALRDGVSCPFLTGYCMDSQTGETTWKPISPNDCQAYTLLYRGKGNFITHRDRQNPLTYVAVEDRNKVFALTLLSAERMCNAIVWMTEHPRIVVLEKTQAGVLFSFNYQPLNNNVDLTTYMKTKFMYSELNVKQQLYRMGVETIHRRCLLRRDMLLNRLLMAPFSPNVVSTLIKGQLGYVGNVAGEVLYILQCVPRLVEIRRESNCYVELPVRIGNESLFMSPITHILQRYGVQTDCNSLIPPMYYIDNIWTSFNPLPITGHVPQKLNVDHEAKISFNSIKNLGAGGIYTMEEIQQGQDAMLFGFERSAITNIITRKMSGKETEAQGLSAMHMFDPAELKTLAHSTLQQLWSWFTTIGLWTSGLMGILFAFKFVKLVAEVTLNAIEIHRVHGWSIRILASFWDALTMCLLHHEHIKEATKVRQEYKTVFQVDAPPENTDPEPTPTVATAPAQNDKCTETVYPVMIKTNATPSTNTRLVIDM